MAKILVIDDDADMVLASRLALEAAGHTVAEARNGTEGLEKIKADRPDLIVMDVMMDTPTEGFQLALALRSRSPESELAAYRDIPILVLTVIHSTTPLRFGPDEDYLPVDDFIEKPIVPEVFVKRVEALLTAKK